MINTRDVIFNKDKLFDGRLESLKDDLLQISPEKLADLLKQTILPESNEINEPAFEDKQEFGIPREMETDQENNR